MITTTLLVLVVIGQALYTMTQQSKHRKNTMALNIAVSDLRFECEHLKIENRSLLDAEEAYNPEIFNGTVSQSFDQSIKRFSAFTPKAKVTFLYRFIASLSREEVQKVIQYAEAKVISLNRKAA